MNQKSKTKKFVAGLLGATLALSLAFAMTASADTVSDLTAQINSLLATISSLQAKLATIQGGSSSSAGASYTFTKDLTLGSTGADVMNLQKVLNASADTQVAASGAGSPGMETSTFGKLTQAAVIKFQKKNGITPAVGYVGPKTRAVLNEASSTTGGTTGGATTGSTTGGTTGSTTGGTTGGTTGVAGSLAVSSPTQPGATIAPYNATRVPFTKITLTAGASDVTVNSLTIQRTGLANDAAFSGVVLLDESGLQVGVAKTFNSNHQTTLGDPFVVKAGMSRTMTIAGNMETTKGGYAGQLASLSVVGVNTSATVSGSLPIVGASQTINETLTIGTATMYTSSYDPASNLNKNIGTTGVKFSGVKVTAGSAEDITLWSIRWNQTGSAGTSDLANVATVVNGTSYPTVVSADGKYFTSLFPNGIVVQKGFSTDLYVQGDIVGSGSANRTVEFDLYNASDLYMSGNTYMFGILGTANSTGTLTSTSRSIFTTSTPFYGGSTVTIQAGTVTTISKSATAAPAANIAVNVPNQILGAYDTNILGEPISVQNTTIHFNSSAAGLGTLTSVSLLDKNGSVVAGPKDATLVSGTDQSVAFTDTVTYPVGLGTYTIVGKLPSTYTNGSTINASTTPSSDWTTVKGQVTGNTLTLTNGVFSMNTMTVRKAALVVSASSNPASQTVVAGAQKFVFTNLQFDATQSGEDVRVSTIPTHLTATTGTDVSACQLFDGPTALTTGSNVINPATAGGAEVFTLDQSLTIPKGTVKNIAVTCNVSGAAATSDTVQWTMSTTDVGTTMVVTGVTSTNSVTATGSATGGTMTVGTATLVVSTDSSSPSYQVASANTSGVTAGVYKFRATNDSINLQRIVLRLTNTASSSDKDLVLVHIFGPNNTEVGQATFTGGNVLATSTLSTAVLVPRDVDTLITIKADLSTIGASAPVAVSGHLIAVDVDSTDSTGTYGTGQNSGTKVNATGSTAVAGVRMMKSSPVLAVVTGTNALPANAVTDGRLMRFSVTANNSGSVSVGKFLVNLATSSATVTSVNIFGFTDSAFSQPISGVNTGGQLLQNNVNTSTYISSPNIAVYPQTTAGATTTIVVPAGTTRYFEVRGTVTAASGATNYNVVTTLKGDTAYPATNASSTSSNNATGFFMTTLTSTTTTTGLNGPTAGDAGTNSTLNSFLWSPNSTTTAAASDVDWTNGYALPGLPQNGLIQVRTN